jgi:O-antigen/teichoic acid export membrane protein
VVHLLDKFVPGIGAMRVLVCGTLFLSIASLPSYFLITINRTKVLLIGAAITVAAEWALNTTFVKMGFGIRGVAFGAAICQFLYGTALIAYAFRLVPEGERHVTWTVVKTYAPAVYVAAVVALLFRFIPVTEASLAVDLRRGLVHGLILAAATSPLWIFLQRRTGVFTLARNLLAERFGRGGR